MTSCIQWWRLVLKLNNRRPKISLMCDKRQLLIWRMTTTRTVCRSLRVHRLGDTLQQWATILSSTPITSLSIWSCKRQWTLKKWFVALFVLSIIQRHESALQARSYLSVVLSRLIVSLSGSKKPSFWRYESQPSMRQSNVSKFNWLTSSSSSSTYYNSNFYRPRVYRWSLQPLKWTLDSCHGSVPRSFPS